MSGKGAKGLAGKGLSGKGAKGTLGAGKGAAGDKKKPVSRSARAGLTFPVGRVHRQLKLRATANGRVGATAAVYSAAILGEFRVVFFASLRIDSTSSFFFPFLWRPPFSRHSSLVSVPFSR